ncbi:DSD1 family PLP-dependent enzyme [Tundrisphaera sp. TA3]|uniref:DSD1 family PLP-dependent enzyme n=1 Tax=Tundrisphaera sp. TA3 TaxID=3435775 RepID=UPI003EB70F16
MRMSAIGRRVEDLDTPALLLDMDAFDHNVRVMSRTLAERGVAWRPHAKAFKCPAIAHLLRRAGAIGVTVAKVSEAEVMAAGGIDDILIAHLVVGAPKVARLAALQRQADVKVTVDHPDHVGPLGSAARDFGVEIGVLVDVDLGMGRGGVGSPDGAIALARRVAATPGLRFDGLMGYEGHTLLITDPAEKRAAIRGALDILLAARGAVEADGLPCRIISTGGTGSYQITADIPGITEIQAGGGIFACMYYVEGCRVAGHLNALSVLATVVGRPSPDLAVLDIGRKSISDFKQDPVLVQPGGCRVQSLSAEHAVFQLPGGVNLPIGSKVRVVPGYSDFTFVLHDRVLAHRAGLVEASWDLPGRGMLQ